jgi:large subunit ribosomal protein L25
MNTLTLEAASRTSLGRQAKSLRSQQMIPAVIYGSGVESRPISVPFGAFRKVFGEAGYSSLVDMALDGAAPVKAVIKEVQVNPISMEPIHIDFHQVNMTEKMHADIPLTFTGEADAVKVLGGTLATPIEFVEVECLPADLPHEIIVDISVLKTFEDAISVSDLKVASGVEVLDDPENQLAFVEAPLSEEELKKMEESQVGDVSDVKTEAEEKEAVEASEEGAEGAEKKNEGGEA